RLLAADPLAELALDQAGDVERRVLDQLEADLEWNVARPVGVVAERAEFDVVEGEVRAGRPGDTLGRDGRGVRRVIVRRPAERLAGAGRELVGDAGDPAERLDPLGDPGQEAVRDREAALRAVAGD